MTRLPAILLFSLGLVGCVPRGTFSAVLTDGLAGEPVAARRGLARAETDDLTCKVLEGKTNAQGQVTIEGTCGDATYRVEAADRTWVIADVPDFEGSAGLVDGAFKTWRAPKGSGVYLLTDDSLSPVRTASDMSTLDLWETEEQVRYPEGIPRRVSKVEDGSHLLIVGADDVGRLEWQPLIKHDGELRFGNKEHYFDMDPWWYVGMRFTTKTEHERVEATLDTGKVIDVETGDRAFRYVAGGALPAGRYALVGPEDRRTYILDF